MSIVYMERLRITFFFFITTLKKKKYKKHYSMDPITKEIKNSNMQVILTFFMCDQEYSNLFLDQMELF